MPDPGEADLRQFLETAGRSLADAQGALAGEVVDIPTAVAISEAELEVKATLDRKDGSVILQPVTAMRHARAGFPRAWCRRFEFATSLWRRTRSLAPSERPSQTPEKVVDEVRSREDVARLDKIMGGLTYEAGFVPSTKRWVVTARDQEDRPVRHVLVPDSGG